MNFVKKTFTLTKLFRGYAKNSNEIHEIPHPKFARLKEIQKKFGVDDGVPVYLKNGVKDKLLYQASWALVLLGLGLSAQFYVELVMKDMKKDTVNEEAETID